MTGASGARRHPPARGSAPLDHGPLLPGGPERPATCLPGFPTQPHGQLATQGGESTTRHPRLAYRRDPREIRADRAGTVTRASQFA
jgi:hypothetical protein